MFRQNNAQNCLSQELIDKLDLLKFFTTDGSTGQFYQDYRRDVSVQQAFPSEQLEQHQASSVVDRHELLTASPSSHASSPLSQTGTFSCSSSQGGGDDHGLSVAGSSSNHSLATNRNYHEARYKTELCLHFRENNTCPHNDRCLFAHGLSELRPYRGRHPRHKTQKCKSFHENGFCNYGYRCSYIHLETPETIEYIRQLAVNANHQRHRNNQRHSRYSQHQHRPERHSNHGRRSIVH